MKRFCVVLLLLGLIAAFRTPAMAVDVKFSGEYYAAGMYLDKTNLTKSSTGGNPSTAFYFQRLRVKTDFVVSPGLTLTTRADIMERAWGAVRSSATSTTLDTGSAGTKAENENIAIDWAYLTYKAPVGIFSVGYMNDGATGTIFGNSSAPAARIKYGKSFGPATLNLAYTKVNGGENSTRNGVAGFSDVDNDKYGIEGVYTWKDGKAGLNVNYYNYASNRPASDNRSTYFLITPYATAKIGPVALQAELNYATGKQKYEAPSTSADIDLQGISGWVDATADFGKFYVGGSVAYVSGNDPGTTDKKEDQSVTGGIDWDPCLIMFNGDRSYWAGNLAGYTGTTANGNAFNNGYFAQLRGGVRPAEKFDIMASLSWAYADKTPSGTWEGRNYGYEIDVTGTYKITNNLSYMLGAGYWMVGDYYKGTTSINHDLTDNFMVINKLTLTF